jgi:hypothetical protein
MEDSMGGSSESSLDGLEGFIRLAGFIIRDILGDFMGKIVFAVFLGKFEN